MRRRGLFFFLGALGLAGAIACEKSSSPVTSKQTARVVSLAPALTVTLFEIGAGSQIVAVSDYCESPEAARALPRVGTSISPNYEAIARLSPTLIVGEADASGKRQELEALGRTRLLPWLGLNEVIESTRELGRLSGHEPEARRLSERLAKRLDVREPANGPRVLLVLSSEGLGGDLWFIRKNSLHGAALHAAGARNAVPEEVRGPPRLSRERLLELDPDAIVVLAMPRDDDEPPAEREIAELRKLSVLQAVKKGRLSALAAPEAFANDPRILTLIDRLKAELHRLGLLE